MTDILDEPIKEFKENKYTDSAYEKCKTATMFFVLGVLMIILIIMIRSPSDIVLWIPPFFFIISAIYGGLGFMKSLRSIQYKEEDTIKKWLAFIFNAIYVLVIVTIILNNLFDVFRALGLT